MNTASSIPDTDLELQKVLVQFRDSTTHSSRATREVIETALALGKGRFVIDLKVYRVCVPNDHVFTFIQNPETLFISICGTYDAACILLRYPANPLATIIVELTVTGKVIDMYYDDGDAGSRKRHEQEIIVPLAAIHCVRKMT